MQAMTWLLLVPGASNTVLEANVPYARDALIEVLEGQVGTRKLRHRFGKKRTTQSSLPSCGLHAASESQHPVAVSHFVC